MRSIGHPELARMSARVDTTDNKRETEPSSPVSPVAGSPLRQPNTLQSVEPFQERRVMSRFVPLSSNSTKKCWVTATCTAMSSIAQLKMCWNMAWNANNDYKPMYLHVHVRVCSSNMEIDVDEAAHR